MDVLAKGVNNGGVFVGKGRVSGVVVNRLLFVGVVFPVDLPTGSGCDSADLFCSCTLESEFFHN